MASFLSVSASLVLARQPIFLNNIASADFQCYSLDFLEVILKQFSNRILMVLFSKSQVHFRYTLGKESG